MFKKSQKILIIGGCGYIGSNLFLYLKSKKYRVDTLDLELFGNSVNPKNFKKNYSSVSKEFLSKYRVIILLAGHSSVKMCENNFFPAFENNVYNFVSLLNKLTTQKFIYASSSSIYGKTNKKNVTENYNKYLPSNYYDLTKKEIDYYAQLSKINYFSLRLGTVCGYSVNLRTDVMINKMVDTGLKRKFIKIYNPSALRPILGIRDFCRAIETIITKDKPSGIYNIASYNGSISKVAKDVAKLIGGVKIKVQKSSPGYNFSVDTKKFQKTFNFKFKDSTKIIVESLLNNPLVLQSNREIPIVLDRKQVS